MIRGVLEDVTDIETLKQKLKNNPYWILEHKDGCFVFTDENLYFQSKMTDKEFENFPFFENYYFKFKKKFIDYAVITCDDEIYMLFLFNDKIIKPLKINGCFCGDISIHYNTKVTDFHYTCGHTIINNKDIKIIKYFKENIDEYRFKCFNGDKYKGIY